MLRKLRITSFGGMVSGVLVSSLMSVLPIRTFDSPSFSHLPDSPCLDSCSTARITICATHRKLFYLNQENHYSVVIAFSPLFTLAGCIAISPHMPSIAAAPAVKNAP
jgi:hypothetical protein